MKATERAIFRLRDMKENVVRIRALLDGKTLDDLVADHVARAAFERFLEVMSEASRHVPAGWQAEHPNIRWRQIADLGNHLRHAYHKTDFEILWNVYEWELSPLEEAVDLLLHKYTADRQKPSA